jgi:hypothetical protein
MTNKVFFDILATQTKPYIKELNLIYADIFGKTYKVVRFHRISYKSVVIGLDDGSHLHVSCQLYIEDAESGIYTVAENRIRKINLINEN